jgi:hypothetical protein
MYRQPDATEDDIVHAPAEPSAAGAAGGRMFLWLIAIPVVLIVIDAIVFWMAQSGAISRMPAAFKLSDKSSILSYLLPLAWLATAINLSKAQRRHDSAVFRTLFWIIAVLGLDDSLELHEAFGEWIGHRFEGLPMLTGDHYGELLVFAVFGIVMPILLYRAVRKSPPVDAGWGVLFFVLLGMGAFFGVVTDALGSLIFKVLPGESAGVRHGKGVLEEGGEGLVIFAMCAMSFIAARSVPLCPAPFAWRFQRLWTRKPVSPADRPARSGGT